MVELVVCLVNFSYKLDFGGLVGCFNRFSLTYSKFLLVAHTDPLVVTNVSLLFLDEITGFIFDGAILLIYSFKLRTEPCCYSSFLLLDVALNDEILG